MFIHCTFFAPIFSVLMPSFDLQMHNEQGIFSYFIDQLQKCLEKIEFAHRS
jgi:hypothetical protein